ncbi:class I SAM-dependent methyltransferase [Thermodesulfobacteriota bacterium]
MKTDPYRHIAPRYDHLIEPLNRGLRSIGMKMFPPRAGMSVLDIGCGTGTHLSLYQKAGCRVFGIDRSPSMLSKARERLGADAGLVLGDATEMPWPDNKFDLVLTMAALHEMPADTRMAVIGESMRVLKGDGRILLIDFHPGPLRPWKGWMTKGLITVIETLAGREHFRNYRHFITNDGLPGLISAHRLSIEKDKILSGGNIGIFLLTPEHPSRTT